MLVPPSRNSDFQERSYGRRSSGDDALGIVASDSPSSASVSAVVRPLPGHQHSTFSPPVTPFSSSHIDSARMNRPSEDAYTTVADTEKIWWTVGVWTSEDGDAFAA